MHKTRGVLHYFLAQFLPLATLILAAVIFFYCNRVDAELRRLQLEQREHVALGAASLSNDLEAPLRHVTMLAGETAILRAVNDPRPANIALMTESFATLMQRNPYYDQIRWIDENGMEQVRINNNGAGPVIVPAGDLQNKGDRQYFIDMMRQPRGEVLISPMDLNVENSKIEMPYKPTVRLAVAVETTQGKPAGIIIINLLMTAMLDRFSSQIERGDSHAMLLNGDGYWLYSGNLDDEWAFMFEREETLGRRYPRVWKAISARSAGYLIDDGMWSWQHVNINNGTVRYNLHQQSPWIVALNLPQKNMTMDRLRLMLRLSSFAALVLLALALLSWQLAVNRHRREAVVHEWVRAQAELDASQERVADLLQLQETRSVLASIVSSSKDAIIGVGLDDIVTSWNPGAEKLLGYSAREAIGQSIYMLVRPERAGKEQRLPDQIAPGATVADSETTFWHKDGRALDISVTVSPILDDEKARIGTSYIAHDITERKQLEKELGRHRQHLESLVEQQTLTLRNTIGNLELALSKAETATHAKSSFLSNMSHEIRTPMNAVLGLAYLLEKTGLQASQRDLVRKITAAGQLLLGVINDVLDVSKIEAGRMEVEHMPFRLGDVLDNVLNVTAPAVGEKEIRLSVNADDVKAGFLYGDALRLEQILVNLVSNAIKFTARGEVSIGVSVAGTAGDEVLLRFAVTDTGIGIPADKQEEVFQAFTQEDVSTTRRYGGTGLGLTICRHLVQLMDGDIGVISEPDRGSEFWFTLPFRTTSGGQEDREAGMQPDAVNAVNRIAGVRVLVVDDSDINREVATRILEAEGAHVFTADNGRQAVDWLRARPQGVDIVLMDIQMPEIDGHAATRAIREELQLRALPVIALTAGAFKAQQEAALAAGMNDFLSKPYNVSQIISMVSRHASGPGAARQAQNAQQDRPGRCTLDVRTGLEAWGSEEVYRKILSKFAEQYGQSGSDILTHLRADDLSQAAKLAHKLRGSAGTLALVTVYRLAGELEALLSYTTSAADRERKAAELEDALQDARREIARYVTSEQV